MRAVVLLLFCTIWIGGCGCGDHIATRKVSITELGRGGGPIEVDTSALPADAREKILTGNASMDCYVPLTSVTIEASTPVRLILIPATRPAAK